MERGIRRDDRAPARVVGQRLHDGHGLAGGRERRAALDHGAHDQALERDPDREQVEDLLVGEHRDVRAAVALANEQPLVAEGLDRFAHGRAGDAEARRELGLGKARPGRDDAVQDAGAQRGDDGLAGGDGLDGETAHGTARVAGTAYVASACSRAPGTTAHRPAPRTCARRHAAWLTYRIASGSASISAGSVTTSSNTSPKTRSSGPW